MVAQAREETKLYIRSVCLGMHHVRVRKLPEYRHHFHELLLAVPAQQKARFWKLEVL